MARRPGRLCLRWGRFLAAALGLLLPLSSCRPPAGGGRAPVELDIWSAPQGVEERGFIALCRRFEAEHPGVTVHNVGASNMEKLVRAIVAGAPPDLAYLYDTTPVGPLAANGAVRVLDGDFARSGLRESDFLPGAIAQGRYKGHLYAMPVTRDSRALYWNRTVFREAGLNPDRPPQTLEETLTLAARLTRRRPDGTLERLGMPLPGGPELVMALFGGDVVDERTYQITADRPENVEALRWYVRLADAQGGYRAISALTAGFGADQSGQNPLATGKIAMRIDGEWTAMYLEKYGPWTDYAIGEIPHPAARPDLKNLAWQDGDIMVIPNGSRHPQLAWEFMVWMQQPAQQDFYAAVMNNLPSIMALRHSPRLTRGSRTKRALGYVLGHIASDPHNARFLPSLPIAQIYRDTLQNAFDRALFHEVTPEQALATVQARMEREMRRYDP
ncbi:MAG TPA: ABC transporter substrate-binding protein [Chthonomonadaceae bacterium]|nr:ABC transporter substrate-binding protein [Chthonomonadaceae bacterium]